MSVGGGCHCAHIPEIAHAIPRQINVQTSESIDSAFSPCVFRILIECKFIVLQCVKTKSVSCLFNFFSKREIARNIAPSLQ